MTCHLSDMPTAQAASAPCSRACASASGFASRGPSLLLGVAR